MLFCGRELLDRWQLYHQRCLLDICITPYSNAKIAAQTYSVCQFCGENLTHSSGRKESRGGMGQAGGRAGYRGVAQAGLRISTCPNCVKPLPRCAVCLQTMDAANPAAVDPARRTKLLLEPAALGQQQPNVDAAANSFDRWYAQEMISSCLVQKKTAASRLTASALAQVHVVPVLPPRRARGLPALVVRPAHGLPRLWLQVPLRRAGHPGERGERVHRPPQLSERALPVNATRRCWVTVLIHSTSGRRI